MTFDRWGRVSWPGIVSPRSCSYTMSQGTSFGAALLRVNPQPGIPYAAEGTLSLFDGVKAVRLTDCRVMSVKETRDSSGVVWDITIADRRWKWRECGNINLWANQLDPQGKFIPFSVASPVEIATACLQAMGETRYKIDLPAGLSTASAMGLKEFLPTGVNFPPSGVNPPIDWVGQKPMVVLEQLAEMFGRVVVYRWDRDEVWVVPRGAGGPLPAGSVSSTCPGVDVPARPDGVGVQGSATRYQPDLDLMAVGEEWDGRLLPINALSYAPRVASARHKVRVSFRYAANFRYYVKLAWPVDPPGTRQFQSASPVSAGAAATEIVNAINADPVWSKLVTAAVEAAGPPATFTIEAKQPGYVFGCTPFTHCALDPIPDPPPTVPSVKANVLRNGGDSRASWERSFPPYFPGVRATDRLTLSQARSLAQKCVWRYFQLSGRDVSGRGKTIIPGFGPVDRYQIDLLSEQCEQIVPQNVDFSTRDRSGTPVVENFYQGVSKCKPAQCFGSVNKRASGLLYVLDNAKGINTGPDDIVKVDFSIDPSYFCVKFGAPVFKFGAPGTLEEPKLRLRTAVLVRDANTNAYAAFTAVRKIGTGSDIAWERHDDVQLNVIPEYDSRFRVRGVSLLEADPLLRAGYYLSTALIKYEVKASLVNVYNGIEPVQLDGAISQITWNVSGEPGTGTETTASLNHEHNKAVPPYPARRRAEALAAAVRPGQFLGQVGGRADPTKPVPYRKG